MREVTRALTGMPWHRPISLWCRRLTTLLLVSLFEIAYSLFFSACAKSIKTFPSPLPLSVREKLGHATSFSDVFQVVDSVNLQFSKNSIISYFGSAAVSNNGKIAIGDLGNGGQILLFDKAGKFIRRVASSGTAAAETLSPRGLAFTAGDSLVVADSRKERIAIYDTAGNFLWDFRIYAQPLGISVCDNSIYAVTAPLEGKPIFHCSLGGMILGEFGRVPDEPRRLGVPIIGGSISSYKGEYIYYVHPAKYDVEVFYPSGKLLRDILPPKGSAQRSLEKAPVSNSPQAFRDWLRSWDPVNPVMADQNGVILVVYQDKTVSEGKIENVVDLYDAVGNNLASGLRTTYLPVCTDSKGRLYCFQKAVEQLQEDRNPMLYVIAFR